MPTPTPARPRPHVPTLSRVGAIGDVHCQHAALAVALDFLRSKRVEHILAVGDIADGGGGDVNRCSELLSAEDITCVRGNHDRWLLMGANGEQPTCTRRSELTPQADAFFRRLRATWPFETPHGRALLCHAVGTDDMAIIDPDDLDMLKYVEGVHELLDRHRFVVHGHTHRARVLHVEKTTFVNVGTLVPENHPCFAIVDFEKLVAQFFELDGELRVAPGRCVSLEPASRVTSNATRVARR